MRILKTTIGTKWLAGILCLILFSFSGLAEVTPKFHWLNPLPQGNSLNAVAYGNGLYVAVGDENTILTSQDGVEWTVRKVEIPGYPRFFRCVAFGNGRFVIGGSFVRLISTNGVDWQVFEGDDYDNAIVFGQGIFVMIGNDIQTSPDGVHWTQVSAPETPGFPYLKSVAYGDGLFVIAGQSGFFSGDGFIYTSTDGVQWQRQSSEVIANGGWESVTYGNGQFFAVGTEGAAMISEDGIAWRSLPAAGFWRYYQSVTFLNERFYVSFFGGEIAFSNDGTNWTSIDVNSGAGYTTVNALASNGTNNIAVGSGGLILTSPDGTNWTSPMSRLSYSLYSIVASPERLIASTAEKGGILFTSANGSDWTTIHAGDVYTYFNALQRGNGVFVAGGLSNGVSSIFYSSNGLQWHPARINANSESYIGNIAFGNATFVAVGTDYGSTPARLLILTSPDGRFWTRRNVSYSNWSTSIAFGKGNFVIPTEGGNILVSSNGTQWTVKSSGRTNGLDRVSFAGGYFWLEGDYDSNLVRYDGSVWEKLEAVYAYSKGKIIYGGGMYLSLGGSTLQVSHDATRWTTAGYFYGRHRDGVFWKNRFIVVGQEGAVLQSDYMGTCSVRLSTNFARIDFRGGTVSVDVNTINGCPWGVTATNEWVSVPSFTRMGEGTVTLTIEPNASLISRSATIAIGDKLLVIQQGGEFAPVNLVGKRILLTSTDDLDDSVIDWFNSSFPDGGSFTFQRTSSTKATFSFPDFTVALAFESPTVGTFSSVDLGNGTFSLADSTLDVSNDGRADLIWQNTSGKIAGWHMLDNEFTSSVLPKPASRGWKLFDLGDMNLDNSPDFLWQHSDGRVSVWLMDRTNFIASRVLKTAPINWNAIGVGDFNNDQNQDILLQKEDGRLAIWFMKKLAFLRSASLRGGLPVASGWHAVGIADFDHDTQPDILFQHDSGKLALWHMNGADFLYAEPIRAARPPANEWRVRSIVDLDNDGHVDIIFQRKTGEVAAWYMNGTAFISSISLNQGKAVQSSWRLIGPR